MRVEDSFYDRKLLQKYVGLIVAFFLACKFSGGAVYPILVPFAFYCMMKQRFDDLFFIVLIVISSIVCNGWLMPRTTIFVISQRGIFIMLGCFLFANLFGQRNTTALSPLRFFLWYVVYMAIVSIVGWSPLISELKIFLFISSFLALYYTTIGVTQQPYNMKKLRSMVLSIVAFFLIGSVLLIPFPSISYMSYSELAQTSTSALSLFKGITAQPQCLGLVVVMCGVVLLGDFVFSIQRMDKLYMLMLAFVPYLVFKTSSRTAMGGLIAGIFFLSWCVARDCTTDRTWKIKLKHSSLLLGALITMLIMLVPSTSDGIARFAVKFESEGEKTEVRLDTVLASRQGKFDDALENWLKSPIIGNGFQVSEWMSALKMNPLAGSMTAPVEKSTWIYAILEEGGVVGEIIFCWLALYIIQALIRNRAYVGATCFFTMLVLNLGEFSMFSFSGVGGFAWGMVFVGCAMDAHREQEFRSRDVEEHPKSRPKLTNYQWTHGFTKAFGCEAEGRISAGERPSSPKLKSAPQRAEV